MASPALHPRSRLPGVAPVALQRSLALRFLSWAQPQPFFRLSLRAQCVALHLLTSLRLFGPAQTLAQSVITTTTTTSSSSQDSKADPRLSIFQVLKDTQPLCSKPGSSAVFDLLIKSYSSLRMVSDAVAALNLTKSVGLAPGILAYNSIIDAMFRCKTNSLDIQAFYEEMTKSKVSLNVYSYNILIRGFCSYGAFDRGLGFLHEMERVGCLPNVVTFNTLVDAHCKSKRADEAFALLTSMLQKGVQPNLVTYNAILHGLLVDEMIGRGLNPNEVTYNTLVNGYCNEGDVHRALVVHSEMVKNGIAPDVVTYTSLISAMCRDGNLARAMEFVKQMEERGLRPNEVTYTTLIDGFSRRVLGRFSLGHEEMIDNGFVHLLVHEALMIVQEMEEKCLMADVVTYSTMVAAYLRHGELEKALSMTTEMIGKGISPDKVTYSSLIRGFCEERRLAEAHELFDKMLSLNISPDEYTYTTLIDAYCKEGDIEKPLFYTTRCSKKGSFLMLLPTVFL
ncbi:unnamed protein product [Spirodela intermedia]|uniref:Uncharacterized protein n=1 Tax=Spirodela intermedia TaxID=51605 RepID=A0A7I8I9Y7_SPIIN|nr:unnamed protein product [Spirodela intermedia]CAA6654338.1 unnamed protein product [Spirodela intermedia]